VVTQPEQSEQAATNDKADSGSPVEWAIEAALGILFTFVLTVAVYLVARLGYDGARQFSLVRGDIAEGARLGYFFAAAVAVLTFGAGTLCLVRRHGRGYVLPGWAGQFLVIVIALLAFVLFFLSGIGGLGGPPTDTSAVREFGRAIRDWFPQIPIFGVIAATEVALMWRTLRWGRNVSLWRVPLLVSAFSTALVAVLVGIAVSLNAAHP
jgi:hypothetical protein